MKRILIAAAFCLLSSSVFGWNLKDHRDMARLALEDVAGDWGLNEPCEIHPLEAFLEKLRPLRPEIADAWQFSYYLKINPKIDLNVQTSLRFPEGTPKAKKLAPLEILSLYATDADDGRDQDLFLRDDTGKPIPMFPDQKWFGSVQGPNSQAFRHIEKPPFSLKDPISTFGWPLRAIGEASQRTEIYFQLSQLAFALGEDYWGWRFLAGGLHYLQDLHQPYHAGQASPTLLKRGLEVLLSWGWDEKGFIGSFAHVVSNSHRFFETYVDQANNPGKLDALGKVKGRDLSLFPGSTEALARSVRDFSNGLYDELSKTIEEITGASLYGRAEFFSDGDKGPDNSRIEDFLLTPIPESSAVKIFEIVADCFASAGKATRTYVRAALDERQNSRKPDEILAAMDRLLPRSSEAQAGGEPE